LPVCDSKESLPVCDSVDTWRPDLGMETPYVVLSAATHAEIATLMRRRPAANLDAHVDDNGCLRAPGGDVRTANTTQRAPYMVEVTGEPTLCSAPGYIVHVATLVCAVVSPCLFVFCLQKCHFSRCCLPP
jgi:hypothetical protein